MSGPQSTMSHEVIAEPDQVWKLLTDLDRRLKILTSVRSLERTGGTPGFDVGTQWQEMRVVGGEKVAVNLVVTAIQPGLSVNIDADVDGGRLEIVYRVKPSSIGTRLEADLTVESQSSGLGKRMLGAMAGNRAGRAMKETIEQDLRDIGANLRA
jgi:carbon monoxide dehydrogenase subunit G